jgi:hypothetical protein
MGGHRLPAERARPPPVARREHLQRAAVAGVLAERLRELLAPGGGLDGRAQPERVHLGGGQGALGELRRLQGDGLAGVEAPFAQVGLQRQLEAPRAPSQLEAPLAVRAPGRHWRWTKPRADPAHSEHSCGFPHARAP